MLKKLSILLLSITLLTGNIKSQVNSCFEIESILVDACAPDTAYYIWIFLVTQQLEGYNEMLRFRVGPNPLNTADMVVKRWGNKSIPWLGLYGPNAKTANTVAALNATVQTPCGLLLEPENGVLPANANVLLISSYAVSTVSNSFADLSDTLYVIFHNEKNIAGHFLNNNPNPDPEDIWQSPVIEFGPGCRDSVAYYMPDLVKTDGTKGLEDGARVDFTPDGTPTYVNYGCKALVNSVSALWVSPGTVQPTGGIIHLDSLVKGTPGGYWTGQGISENVIDPSLWCGRTLSVTYHVFGEICNTIVEDSLTLDITIDSDISAAWTAPSQICSSSDAIELNGLVTGTPGGTWSGEGVSDSIFNPAGLNGSIELSYKVVDGTCEQTKKHSIMVIEEGNAAWQNPMAFCTNGGRIGLNQFITGTIGGVWKGTGISGDSLDLTGLSGSLSISYISGIEPCADTVTHNINIITIPAPILPESYYYCDGIRPDTIIFTGEEGATVKWYSDPALENLISIGDTLIPSNTSSNYYAIQSIGSCNSAAGSASVNFFELPASPTGTTPVQYCPETTAINLSVEAGGENQIIWYANAELTDSIATGNTYQATSGTSSLWVIASDSRCKSLPFKIDLSQLSFVTAHIYSENSLVWCGSGEATLQSDTSAGNLWSPGGSTESSITVHEPGTYTLKVTGACNTDETSITIIDGGVIAGFTANPLEGEAPLTVNITPNEQPEGSQTYWLLNEDTVSLLNNNTLLLKEEGQYTITQLVISSEECSDTASVVINVLSTKVSLVIPNSFTPNGDGYNDAFVVKSSGLTQFKGTIFNRWGNKIFEWEDPNKGWDGQYNGSTAPAGVYFYVVKATGKNNQTFEKKGDVTLLR